MTVKPNINVLYVDLCGSFGGATRSLGTSIAKMNEWGLKPFFLVQSGSASSFYKSISSSQSLLSIPAGARFTNSYYATYKGVRILLLFRELLLVPISIIAVFLTFSRYRNKIDIIHLNEVHELFTGVLLKLLFRKPMVVHVRCRQSSDKSSLPSFIYTYFLQKFADYLIFIDYCTRSSFYPLDLPNCVIHNSLSGRLLSSKPAIKSMNSSSTPPIKLGFIGNPLKMKGILDIANACSILKSRDISFELIIAGDFTAATTLSFDYFKSILLSDFLGLQQNVSLSFKRIIDDNCLLPYITFLGKLHNLDSFFRDIDLILFPSHLDAPGRPIFEAALYSKPSIACISNDYDDTFIHGVTGVRVNPHDPTDLADCIHHLSINRSTLHKLGASAFKLVQQQNKLDSNSASMFGIYRSLLS